MRIVTALTRIVTSYWAERPRFLVTALRVQRMEQIEDVSIEPCTNSKFIQPYRVKYKQVWTPDPSGTRKKGSGE